MEDIKVKSLSKALSVLECFSVEKPELGITEICSMLGLYKSNVHNIVSTFERHGYLTQNPENNKYRLGLNILKLGNIISSNLHERDYIFPHIKQIAIETDEIVYYSILHNGSVLYLDYACTSGTILEKSKMGITAPIHSTATGKAMLAYLPETESEAIMNRPMQKFTDNTIDSEERMSAELARIREMGYSVDNMESEYGIMGVGVPILDKTGYPFAGISISGPSLRFDEDKIMLFANILMRHKVEIEKQLL